MAQTGFTPISTYFTTTASAVPTAGNLVNGELALNINTADGKLFYKDSAGVVQVLATKASASGSFTNLAYTGTLTGGTGVVNLGSGQFYKDASGNVGLGTASPTVYAANDKVLQLSSGANGGAIRISNTATGTNGGWLGYQLGLDSYLSNVSAGALVFATSNQEKMRIDSSGNVGIGATNPTGKLEVVTGTTATMFNSNNNLNTGYVVKFASAYTSIGNNFSAPLAFLTGDTERMRIDPSGNLIVGTTTLPFVSTVTLGFAAKVGGGFQVRSAASNNDVGIDSASGSVMNFYSSTAYSGAISVNGNITTYGSISDYRLKENIAPITGALEKVSQLNPVTFNFKDNGQSSQGFIAHELQEIIPDAVTGTKDAIDKDGKPQYQGIDTSFLVATLTSAIQEQQTLIENLTTRLTALEGK